MPAGSTWQTRTTGWMTALAIAVIAFLVRLPNLFVWWLNPDEGIYYSIVMQTDWTGFWTEIANNAHPPLFNLMTLAVSALTTDFATIRLLSLAFGSVAIFAAWMVGREIVSDEPVADLMGLVAATILAFSSNNSSMSQLIRPYSMLLALLLLTLYALLRYRRTKSTRYLFWYSVLLSLALLTHYSSILAFGVLAILMLGDFITGGFGRREIIPVLIAHIAPCFVCAGLYLFHLRPHLIGSALEAEALQGWLAPYMIHSLFDAAAHLYGYMGYLISGALAGPTSLLWFAGLFIAVWRRYWTILVLNLGALCIATVAATAGMYPFGPVRHATWLSAFMVFSVSLTLTQIFVQKGRSKAMAVTLIAALVAVGLIFDATVGKQTAQTYALDEFVLRTTDARDFQHYMAAGDKPGTLVMPVQTYYTLVPLFITQSGTRPIAGEGTYFRFRWDSMDVIVVNSWNLSARPEDIGNDNHLYTVMRRIDRQIPHIGLSDEYHILLAFAGWPDPTPCLLKSADQRLPESDRLISNWKEVPGLTVFQMDIASYFQPVKESLKR